MDTVHASHQPASPASLQPVVPVIKPGLSIPEKTEGRPRSLDEYTVSKLIAAFQRGHTDTKACEYAKISRQTLYKWIKLDPVFADKITEAKNFWVMAAGDHITNLLTDKSRDPQVRRLQVKTSQWVMEKHEPEIYANKVDPAGNVSNTQNNYLFITNEQLKQLSSNSNLASINPTALVEELATPNVAGGAAEGSTAPVYQDAVRSDDTEA